MRQAAYTAYPLRRTDRGRLILIAATVTIILAAVAAAVALYIAVTAWSAAGALTVQNTQLQTQVTGLKGQVTGLKSKEGSDYTAVGRILAPILPYTTSVCSQDLTGPSGPTQYYFVCTQKLSQQPTG